MEILFLLLYTLIFISISYWFLFPKSNSQNAPLPPSTTGWPFLRETFKYLSMSKKGMPEKFISDRKDKYSTKIFKTSLLGEKMVILCSNEGNKFVFSNEKKLVHSWWPRSGEKIFPNTKNVNTKGESINLREMLPLFIKPDSLRRYLGIMDEIAKQHLKTYWDGNQEVTVHPFTRKHTYTLGCQLLLNIEDQELIEKLEGPFGTITTGFISLPINIIGTKFNCAIRAAKELHKEFELMIKKRRSELMVKKQANLHDILSQMLTESDENDQIVDDWDIANKILGLLTGAHDTASIALVSIIRYLAELPEIYDGVLKEQMDVASGKFPEQHLNWEDLKKMKYSWNVVNEVLRLSPPLQGTFREDIRDFTYEGYLIPKGWKLHWNVYCTHKNPKYFPDPEKFDPTRFEGNGPAPYSFVPFGGGPQMCPGNEYARLEILTFIHNLVIKYRLQKVIPDDKIIIDPIPMPAHGLPIRLIPHKP